MSTARAEHQEQDAQDEGIVLSPEEEAALELAIARNDENERAGRVIPLDRFLADRGIG